MHYAYETIGNRRVDNFIEQFSFKFSLNFQYQAENLRIRAFHQRSFGHIQEMMFSTNQVIPQINQLRKIIHTSLQKLSKNRGTSQAMNQMFDKNGQKIYDEFLIFNEITAERMQINSTVSDRLSNLLVRLQNAGKNSFT